MKKSRKLYRSAITGCFVSEAYAKKHKRTTVAESTAPKKKRRRS